LTYRQNHGNLIWPEIYNDIKKNMDLKNNKNKINTIIKTENLTIRSEIIQDAGKLM
jgi:hypothetical protein